MARKPQDNPALDMTPMIDVVFELIIFFVVTIKQQDILSKLNVNKPAPSDSKSSSSEDKDLIEIEIGKGRKDRGDYAKGVYVLKGEEISLEKLNDYLKSFAAKSAKPEEEPIVIKCTGDSPHGALVNLLDKCYAHKLYSISLFSL